MYPGKVTFVSENFGASKLADHYGVKGYPAVFVDDVLVAVPRDFGYFGEVEGAGRYAPWRNADNQAKFKADVVRMIDLILAGKKDVVSQERGKTGGAVNELAALPSFKLTDLAGHPLATEQLTGRLVLVEFWATWCPPCRSTLQWLGELKQRYGDNLAVLALAVESPQDQVRIAANSLSPGLRWAIADAPTAAAFGDLTSVPTMFIFDRSGRTAQVLYGAPPDLHQQAETTLKRLFSGAGLSTCCLECKSDTQFVAAPCSDETLQDGKLSANVGALASLNSARSRMILLSATSCLTSMLAAKPRKPGR